MNAFRDVGEELVGHAPIEERSLFEPSCEIGAMGDGECFDEEKGENHKDRKESPNTVSQFLSDLAGQYDVASHEEMSGWAYEMWWIKSLMVERFFTPELIHGLDYFIHKQPVNSFLARDERRRFYAALQENPRGSEKYALINEIVKTWPNNNGQASWLQSLSERKKPVPAGTIKELNDDFLRLKDIENKFVQHNLRFVIAIVKKIHMSKTELQWLSKDDLVQEGAIGLKRAAQIWAPDRGSFLTYASLWVYQTIGRVRIRKGNTLYVPNWVFAMNGQILRENARSMRTEGRPLSREEKREIIAATDLGQKKPAHRRMAWVDSMLFHIEEINRGPVVSHSNLVREDDEDTTFLDFCEADRSYQPEERLAQDDPKRAIQVLMDFCAEKERLTEREEQVIRMRFGLNPDAKEYTLDEIGRLFSVTRERIRQIEEGAFRKIKKIAEQTPDRTPSGRVARHLQDVRDGLKCG